MLYFHSFFCEKIYYSLLITVISAFIVTNEIIYVVYFGWSKQE